MHASSTSRPRRWLCAMALGMTVLAGATGCQSQYGGVTLPSAYYLTDDIYYQAPGSEMKLSREATAMREAREQEAAPE